VAAAQALQVLKGGGVKLTELAGAIFKNREDKKGQQETTKYYAEHELGVPIDFPGTSTIQYALHSEAATMLIRHRPFFIRLLEMVRDKKNDGNFMNLKQNVYDGLHDIPTVTELAVLSTYSQSTTIPFLSYI
jgi:hypothetical protein